MLNSAKKYFEYVLRAVLCASGALYVNIKSRKVDFTSEKCTACGRCVKACPVQAMEGSF